MIEAHNFEQRDAGFGWMINHLPTIVWQRRYYALSIFLAFLIVSVAAAFILPTHYRSSGVAADRIPGTSDGYRAKSRDRAPSSSALRRSASACSAAAT